MVQQFEVLAETGFGKTGSVRACEDAPRDMAPLVTHLDAVSSLARWLGRNPADAEDLVQEAYLRACIYIRSFRGGDLKAWLLTIVRNCYYDRLRKSGVDRHSVFDESLHSAGQNFLNPESSLLSEERNGRMKAAMEELPLGLREVLVLREFKEMSYKEIASVAGIPVGTVMSRLSRARRHMQQNLQVEDLQARVILRVEDAELNRRPR